VALKSLQSKKIILFVALGLAAFILYLYFYVGTGNFLDVVKSANVYYYTSAFVAFFFAALFSAITWHSLLGNLNVKSSFRRVLFLTWAGYFFDATLPEPGWSGDISKAYLLSKKDNEDVGKVVASVVSQKIIGMAVTILILVVGFGLLAVNVTLEPQVIVFFGAVMSVAVASFLVVYFMSTSFKATKAMLNRLLIPLLSFFLRSRFNESQFRADSEKFLSMFHKGIDALGSEKKALLRPVFFYVLSVSFDIAIVFFVFTSLGYPIPVDKVLIVYALTGTLASIGVSFVGLTEIIMSTAYQVLSIPLAVSFSVTLLTRIVTLWFKLIVGYFAFQWASVGVLLGKRKPPAAENKIDGKVVPASGEP
jgi:uncharacterized protein (TIRG00374 family)